MTTTPTPAQIERMDFTPTAESGAMSERRPDGIDCTCAAYGECECACGADWTTAETYELRDRVAYLEAALTAAHPGEKK